MGKSLLDSVFGNKLHPDFPRKFRLDTHFMNRKLAMYFYYTYAFYE
jgi:hypothetical protein